MPNLRQFLCTTIGWQYLTLPTLICLTSKLDILFLMFYLLQPLTRIREELKSYVRRHNLLAEREEAAKNILQSYNILEDFEQLKLSENSSLSLEEETFASNQDACSSSASTGEGNLKPKSLISNALTVNKKEIGEKRVPVAKDRASIVKNPRHLVAVKDANVNNTQKKSQKPRRAESKSGNAKVKGSTKESVRKEGGNKFKHKKLSFISQIN